jgi:hypothetical protein
MTPEAQRVAIARAHLGLEPIAGEKESACGHLIMLTSDLRSTAFCPDYLKDLNAMHEAEKTLGDPQLFIEYEDQLSTVMNHVGWCWHATAAQRGEAFLRTLNLWKDSTPE